MESEGKNETRNKKRKKNSKGEASGEGIGRGKSVINAVNSGRVRKPKRGNRGGARKPRNHKDIFMARTDESVRRVNGEAADSGNRKKKGRNLLTGPSQDDRLKESDALIQSKESKPKKTNFKSKFQCSLQQGDSAIEDIYQATEQPKPASKSLSVLEKMRARLSGGRFRMLNESLYTCNGDEAFELFQQDPGAFNLYHAGYQEQMLRWPVLPVTVVTKWLKSRSPNLVVADFGCGDARLAKSIKNKVFSLDLVSSEPSVIACNMANTPLETSSTDVAVFCLSLMGTDYPMFLVEAHRVLRSRGWLLIAEVKSRLDAGNGGAGPQAFISAIRSLGFFLDSQDDSNKMFHMFYFQKTGSKHEAERKIRWPELKPCVESEAHQRFDVCSMCHVYWESCQRSILEYHLAIQCANILATTEQADL